MRHALLRILASLLLGAANLSSPPPARATTITIFSADGANEGFNDTGPADPASTAGGNSGVNLGEQRSIAARYAAIIWSDFLSSTVPISVSATFNEGTWVRLPDPADPNDTGHSSDPNNPLICDATSAVVGTARAGSFHGNFSKAPIKNTWYPQALANSLEGTDLNTNIFDIIAEFNSTIGTGNPDCLPENGWYYGLDGNPPAGQFDFVTIALREFARGLGFKSLVDPESGAKFGGFNDVFSVNLKDVSTGKLYTAMTNAERVVASVNDGNLRWIGANVVAARGGDMPMYTPPVVDPALSVSSWADSLSSGSVTIPAGSATALITVNPVTDATVEGDETVILTLSANPAYTLGAPNNATVTIADDGSPPVLPAVSITADLPDASEAGPTAGRFTVSRTGSTAAPLIVNYTIGGTATNGIDYTTLPTSVTIPAGAATALIAVTPVNDAVAEDSETVILTLRPTANYNVGTPDSAIVTIADNESPPPPTVSIVANLPNASEAGPTAGQFTVRRTGSTAADLVVNYARSGSANSGSDFTPLATSVTIPAGSATETITVTPVNDTQVENNETVVVTLTAAGFRYIIGVPSSATVTIADNDSPSPPTVSISATAPNASEAGPTAGQFTVSRTGSTASSLNVNYLISGTATNTVDYATLSGSVTILAGSATALITVTPVDDLAVEGDEMVVLSLSANAAYTIGSPKVATVTIADNDTAAPLTTVSIVANAPNASEIGPTPGQFTVSRSGSTAGPLTVYYTIGGSATNGTDYTLDPQELMEPLYTAANHDVGFALEALQDIGWNLDPPGTVNIIASPDKALEGEETGTFIVHRTGPTDQAITVFLTVSGTATANTDYPAIPASVVIPVGESSVNVDVTPLFDAIATERDESVVVQLQASPAPPAYTLGTPTLAVITIKNNLPAFGKALPPQGEIGVPYNFPIPVSGGEEPYVVTFSKGALPDGLALGSPVISGTPSPVAKTATFTIKVTDLQGVSASKSYTITILRHVNIVTTSLKAGRVNRFYSATLRAAGGKKPYTWTTIDALPDGLVLASDTGAIGGAPTESGPFLITSTVTDALGATADKVLTLTIN